MTTTHHEPSGDDSGPDAAPSPSPTSPPGPAPAADAAEPALDAPAPAPPGPSPRPVAATDRIEPLDVIRGFALLGILVPNMVDFGLPNVSELSPHTVFPAAEPWNAAGVWVVYTFFRGKMMALFAMLFGAGVILYGRKFDRREPLPPLYDGAGLWHRRMGWLFAIGLLHLILVWDGDILHTYAIAGVAWLWWVRRWRARWLLALGIGVHALAAGLPTLAGIASGVLNYPSPVQVHEYRPAHAGDLVSIIVDRLGGLPGDVGVSLFLFAWISAGLMTLGMALTRLGLLTGTLRTRTCAALAAGGLLFGVAAPGVALAAAIDPVMTDWRWNAAVAMGAGLIAPLGAIGYVAVLVLLLRTPTVGRALAWLLAPVGRTALTNYVLHSVAGAFVFYGAGLGLEGRLHHGQLFALTLVFWAASIIASRLWLTLFRFGPLEWVWRCLTYWRIEPILRLGRVPPAA